MVIDCYYYPNTPHKNPAKRFAVRVGNCQAYLSKDEILVYVNRILEVVKEHGS